METVLLIYAEKTQDQGILTGIEVFESAGIWL